MSNAMADFETSGVDQEATSPAAAELLPPVQAAADEVLTVLANGARAVLLSGAPGSGKSAALGHIAEAASRNGSSVSALTRVHASGRGHAAGADLVLIDEVQSWADEALGPLLEQARAGKLRLVLAASSAAVADLAAVVDAHIRIAPVADADAAAYLRRRGEAAEGGRVDFGDEGAALLVGAAAGSIFRLKTLAGAALMEASFDGNQQVEPHHARQAIEAFGIDTEAPPAPTPAVDGQVAPENSQEPPGEAAGASPDIRRETEAALPKPAPVRLKSAPAAAPGSGDTRLQELARRFGTPSLVLAAFAAALLLALPLLTDLGGSDPSPTTGAPAAEESATAEPDAPQLRPVPPAAESAAAQLEEAEEVEQEVELAPREGAEAELYAEEVLQPVPPPALDNTGPAPARIPPADRAPARAEPPPRRGAPAEEVAPARVVIRYQNNSDASEERARAAARALQRQGWDVQAIIGTRAPLPAANIRYFEPGQQNKSRALAAWVAANLPGELGDQGVEVHDLTAVVEAPPGTIELDMP